MQDLVQAQAVLVLEAPQLHQIPSTPADSAQILEVCRFIQKHRFRYMLAPAIAMTFTSDLGLFYIVAFTLRIEPLFAVNERNGIISLMIERHCTRIIHFMGNQGFHILVPRPPSQFLGHRMSQWTY
jgi:hypothetical protein